MRLLINDFKIVRAFWITQVTIPYHLNLKSSEIPQLEAEKCGRREASQRGGGLNSQLLA